MESKRRPNDVLQSRNGREWAQNNKIGISDLTDGPGGTPDPKLPSQAMRVDEEDGASSGCLARNDGATTTLARRYAWEHSDTIRASGLGTQPPSRDHHFTYLIHYNRNHTLEFGHFTPQTPANHH
ncbi:hypothetical protein E3N88_10190 [Mikania micrantha]|uniref:Uncharacterized protein n=1 Tax=Mikania micrantha TaxID=192012 RepID=A0A5N6PB36_9ASTR|nr:hypothetical protein E3N88_10190 [Mikania micrantha]